MALRYPLVLNGTTIEELQSADSLDVTSASISGDLTFTGTGARVKANFSDPIATNRLLFQTSTANSTTLVGIMPNGTGTTSGIYGVNSSTLTNASYFDLRVSGSGSDVRLTSDYYGAGTYLPITFYTGGLEQVRITANSGGPANFQFSQSGTRVTGDFSNGTAANRVLFQTSTANSPTAVGIMPSGTGSTSIIYGTNSSNLTNASYFDLRVSGSGNDVRLTSDYYGAGTYLPITFYTGGSERVRIDTSGNFSIAGLTASRALATDASKNLVSSTVTSTELGYLSGVTSAIQTQLNGKAGTADANTFTNNQIISVNSASDALRITQTGAGNALKVEDSTNPDSTPFIIDANGAVISGRATQFSPLSGIAAQVSISANQYQVAFSGSRNSDDSTGAQLAMSKSRGTETAQTIVADADSIGQIWWTGYDGANYLRAASIVGQVDGTPGTNDMPGRLVFSTTADGASSPSERMRIDNQGRVGIGGTPSAGRTLEIRKSLSGNTFSYQVNNEFSILSDVTSEAVGYQTFVGTQATTFTLTSLRHFKAAQGTIGAGSTVTNQAGFWAESTLTGATNNYGFYSNIASGSGRYNFYAAGTADNYFGGPVVVSASSSSDALRITQTGAGNALVVEDSANPDSTPVVIDTNGNLIVGATNTALMSGYGQFQVIGTSSLLSAIGQFSADTLGAIFSFNKSRSTTLGSPATIIASGDTLGQMRFSGADGSSFIRGAQISAEVDGTPGLNDMPGRLVFSTTADGASSPTERMRIDNAGNVLIGIAGVANYSFVTAKNITGGSSAYGVSSIGAIQSDVTTLAQAFRSRPATAAVAFTLGSLQHFAADQGTIGAGSTLTNQYGFFVNSTLTGATNNYGFYSNIASGTGRYNFYAAGTADNYFAGSVGIGTAATSGRKLQSTITSMSVTNPTGVYVNGNADATATSLTSFSSFVGQDAGSSIGAVSHFSATQSTFSGTVSAQYGYLVSSTLTGATNNYGFYSNIASGSGRYNFYAAGTADNYFAGLILSNSSIKSNSATAGVGYGTGAGGTVTQTISRTTGVTLNKICGSVTLFSASATVAANFTVTNSTVSATDTILCSVQASGATEIYQATSYAVANGSFKIYMASPGTATEAPTINFTVIKSVTA